MGTSSEFFNIETETFRAGPDLPESFSSHCAVTIDEYRVALTGGYSYKTVVYIYDYRDDSFTELPSFQVARRGHFCGIADSGNGKELIVAGE